ncbi:MAG TPA: hypothetical protein VMH02_13190 [Verrucomicrobiae bacterium]|nr:hypothetical protein [Verrucomicrobiae bacterium]
MLILRGALAVLMVAVGSIVAVRTAELAPSGGLAIVPGLVLGAAMIALGVHRIALIVRMRGRT